MALQMQGQGPGQQPGERLPPVEFAKNRHSAQHGGWELDRVSDSVYYTIFSKRKPIKKQGNRIIAIALHPMGNMGVKSGQKPHFLPPTPRFTGLWLPE